MHGRLTRYVYTIRHTPFTPLSIDDKLKDLRSFVSRSVLRHLLIQVGAGPHYS